MATPQLDLKRADRISQRYKDIVFGFIHQSQRALFASAHTNLVIDDLIKHLCLLYYYQIFESSLLSKEEHSKFIDLLYQHKKPIVDQEWHRVYEYKKSKDVEFDRGKFIEHVYDKKKVIYFARTEADFLVGGYTATGWTKKLADKGNTCLADADAFIFGIRSKEGHEVVLSNVRKTAIAHAVVHNKYICGGFSDMWALYLFYNARVIFGGANASEHYEDLPAIYDLAMDKAVHIEAFQIK